MKMGPITVDVVLAPQMAAIAKAHRQVAKAHREQAGQLLVGPLAENIPGVIHLLLAQDHESLADAIEAQMRQGLTPTTPPAIISYAVNGQQYQTRQAPTLSYETIVELAGQQGQPLVTFLAADIDAYYGTLRPVTVEPGSTVTVTDGMAFTVSKKD